MVLAVLGMIRVSGLGYGLKKLFFDEKFINIKSHSDVELSLGENL